MATTFIRVFSFFKYPLLCFIRSRTNISPNYLPFTIHFYSALKKQLPIKVSLQVNYQERQPVACHRWDDKERASKQSVLWSRYHCPLFLTVLLHTLSTGRLLFPNTGRLLEKPHQWLGLLCLLCLSFPWTVSHSKLQGTVFPRDANRVQRHWKGLNKFRKDFIMQKLNRFLS